MLISGVIWMDITNPIVINILRISDTTTSVQEIKFFVG